MRVRKNYIALAGAIGVVFCLDGWSQLKPAAPTVQVHVVITDTSFRNDKELPALGKEDVKVIQGKNVLRIAQLIPAQRENAALQLMILIDDVLDPGSLGNSLNDIRSFINEQPSGTAVGLAYMSNAGFQLVQNFTPDHNRVARAIRLPHGTSSSMDSPYLSLISLLKSWPQEKVRREVLMVSDGIDRLREMRGALPTISADANTASELSQRFNVIVFPIYSPGIDRLGRSSLDLEQGLSGMTKIADETGGECFHMSTSTLISFKPYLDRFYRLLNNQYYLVFNLEQKKKAALARINVEPVKGKNSDIFSPDNVWVPPSPKAGQ